MNVARWTAAGSRGDTRVAFGLSLWQSWAGYRLDFRETSTASGAILRSMRFVFGAAALVLCHAAVAPSARAVDFETWLDGVRAEALAGGISQATVDAALDDTQPIATVLELDRRQPEGRITFARYLASRVPDSRVETARARLRSHRALLDEVAARYRVQPRFIVALWGLESDFGRYMSPFPVIDSLATLAHDGRRGDYFRAELLAALRIIDGGHVAPGEMRGSWAGALGQCQFMPSNFFKFAVDYDNDGRRDIWGTMPDVFASIANYLSNFDWRDDQTWGREVRLPSGFDRSLIGLDTVQPIGAWQDLGARLPDGGDLPSRQLSASIVMPDGAGGQAYLVYGNFHAILDWNRSTYFALSVGILADRVWSR